MIFAAREIVWVGLCLILFTGAHLLHLQLDRFQNNAFLPQRFAYLPDGKYLKLALLGYGRIGADFLWLQAIQAMGEQKVSEEDGRKIFRVLDVVTTLDPTFVRAYEAGGIALCTLVVLPVESNRLLEKGIQHNPEAWMLPFLLGVNYYFEMGDDEKAAEYFGKASRLRGAPAYLASLTARLFITGREPLRAVEFLTHMYQETTDENLKNFLADRLEEAIVERDLYLLETAIGQYTQQYHRPLERLEDLVTANILRELPKEPSGVPYVYDRSSQTVRSSSLKERVKVHGFRRSR